MYLFLAVFLQKMSGGRGAPAVPDAYGSTLHALGHCEDTLTCKCFLPGESSIAHTLDRLGDPTFATMVLDIPGFSAIARRRARCTFPVRTFLSICLRVRSSSFGFGFGFGGGGGASAVAAARASTLCAKLKRDRVIDAFGRRRPRREAWPTVPTTKRRLQKRRQI